MSAVRARVRTTDRMKKTAPKNLSLRRTTIRGLSQQQLESAKGGAALDSWIGGGSCNSCTVDLRAGNCPWYLTLTSGNF